MSTTAETTLASLLSSSSFLLAYALPLFFLSLLLTFAGAFLTLDRTRAFAPRYDALKPPEATKFQHAEVLFKTVFRIEGGIGGIALGFVTGVHFTTFLALLIPNVSTSKPLSPGAFLAVWLLPSIACSVLAARWRFVTLAFAGIAGYSTFALAFSVILHPSLLTRLILVAVFTPIGLVMCLLPIARTQHVFVRLAMASVGAFGTILAIALLAHIPSWIEVWDRLWIKDGDLWGTAQEKGLSAAFCLFVLIGAASDWFLKRKLGENPDEKWDSYLADYAATLPNGSDRAGHFQPLQSFWARHFGHNKGLDPVDKDIVFPTDAELKLPVPDSPLKLYKKRSLAGPHATHHDKPRRFTPPQEYLRKDRRPGVKGRQRTRELIKFEPLDPYTQSDSDDDEDFKKGVPPFVRSPTRSDSMATLADDQPARKTKDDPLSDTEQDVTANRTHFLQRHSLAHRASSAAISQAGTGSSTTLTPVAFTPVPATPSLIKAVERVNAAQREVFSRSTDGLPLSSSIPSTPVAQPVEPRPHNWNAFWDDVKTKAGHGFHPHRRDGAVDGASGAATPKR
ncbi:hypothetical protein L226DRAFT_90545 [Lentinus tigrinus ALCF2SS1-7]|uniref:DUF4203 domain-containing protein n=1 Tax=Lentinus tigrinus ALCF2SS1-6 TaxID=1328759 RepID=A0A5C2RVF4_9APHY|nr:hypothetical protein L227DRAFT_344178 [Lentinus tigrinus ALCF2SS1-6]RPD73895.1 hypothetical protein L226DRAFT_90545 [Lentinus tigrinus ALCF2SS1-7]